MLKRYSKLHLFIIFCPGVKRDLSIKLFSKMLLESSRKQQPRKGYDQHLLSSVVWPKAKRDSISHDSYLCLQNNPRLGNRDNTHRAFPTKRVNGPGFSEPEAMNFIGSNGGKLFLPHYQPCPEKCRPANHQDWDLC